MTCEHTATYGNELFCKICGMDIGLSFVKKHNNIFCCKDCANKKKGE